MIWKWYKIREYNRIKNVYTKPFNVFHDGTTLDTKKAACTMHTLKKKIIPQSSLKNHDWFIMSKNTTQSTILKTPRPYIEFIHYNFFSVLFVIFFLLLLILVFFFIVRSIQHILFHFCFCLVADFMTFPWQCFDKTRQIGKQLCCSNLRK